MPIDSSIYSQIRVPEAANPLAQYAQVAQIKNMQTQGRLADLAYGEKEREVTENRNVNDAYREAMGPDGRLDRTALTRAVAQRGMGSRIPVIQKGFADQDKSAADTQKSQIEAHLKKFEVVGQIMSGVKDQASYDMARQQLAQTLGPEASANLPAAYDAATIEQNKLKAMSVKDQLEQKLKAMTFTETQRHNTATENAAIRGQNMTDSRTRDLNAVRADEAKLKREAKEETANLTKASQIASFDTMLGTLDRLSKHAGLARSVGVMGALPTLPGSDSANFQAELNTFQSQAFLPMVAQLKGMGALSDAEGKKLTAAVGALDPKMGEEAFRASVARITADMQAARDRMTGTTPKAGGADGSWDASKPATVSNAADYEKIPSGAIYTSPDGKMRRKP